MTAFAYAVPRCMYEMSEIPATTGDRIGILKNIRSNKDSICHIYTLILILSCYFIPGTLREGVWRLIHMRLLGFMPTTENNVHIIGDQVLFD